MQSHQGTSEPCGTEGGRGELSVWSGIVSARLEEIAGVLETAQEAQGIAPMLDTAKLERRGATYYTVPINAI
jgi:hypothetical protein